MQCGCDPSNCDKVEEEVLKQLESIQMGDIDYEFEPSRISIENAYLGITDSPDAIEGWYVSQMLDSTFMTTSQKCKAIENVTKEDIINCSKTLELDTVYKLVPMGDEE